MARQHDPRRFAKPFGRLQQAGTQFAGAIGSAIDEIPGMVELRQNKLQNELIYSEDIQPQLSNLSQEDLQLTGFTDNAQLQASLKPVKGETNMQYMRRVAQTLAPIAQSKSAEGRKIKEEGRLRSRQQSIADAATAPVRETQQIEAVGAPTREQFRAGELPTRQIEEQREPTLEEMAQQAQEGVQGVTQKELEQVPSFAQAQATQEQELKREQFAPTPKTPEEVAKIKAQTEAAQALTQQRKASALLNKIKANPGFMRSMDNTQLLKAETAARVALGKIPKFESDDFGNETNEPNDEWVNMKLLADRIKSEVDKKEGAAKKTPPSKQALSLTNKIKGSIREELAEVGGENAPTEIRNRMLARAILEHAKKIGVDMAWDGLMQALNEENTVEEILDAVLKQAGAGGSTR